MNKYCKSIICFLIGILIYYFLFNKDLIEGACSGPGDCTSLDDTACASRDDCSIVGSENVGDGNVRFCSTVSRSDLPSIISGLESHSETSTVSASSTTDIALPTFPTQMNQEELNNFHQQLMTFNSEFQSRAAQAGVPNSMMQMITPPTCTNPCLGTNYQNYRTGWNNYQSSVNYLMSQYPSIQRNNTGNMGGGMGGFMGGMGGFMGGNMGGMGSNMGGMGGFMGGNMGGNMGGMGGMGGNMGGMGGMGGMGFMGGDMSGMGFMGGNMGGMGMRRNLNIGTPLILPSLPPLPALPPATNGSISPEDYAAYLTSLQTQRTAYLNSLRSLNIPNLPPLPDPPSPPPQPITQENMIAWQESYRASTQNYLQTIQRTTPTPSFSIPQPDPPLNDNNSAQFFRQIKDNVADYKTQLIQRITQQIPNFNINESIQQYGLPQGVTQPEDISDSSYTLSPLNIQNINNFNNTIVPEYINTYTQIVQYVVNQYLSNEANRNYAGMAGSGNNAGSGQTGSGQTGSGQTGSGQTGPTAGQGLQIGPDGNYQITRQNILTYIVKINGILGDLSANPPYSPEGGFKDSSGNVITNNNIITTLTGYRNGTTSPSLTLMQPGSNPNSVSDFITIQSYVDSLLSQARADVASGQADVTRTIATTNANSRSLSQNITRLIDLITSTIPLLPDIPNLSDNSDYSTNKNYLTTVNSQLQEGNSEDMDSLSDRVTSIISVLSTQSPTTNINQAISNLHRIISILNVASSQQEQQDSENADSAPYCDDDPDSRKSENGRLLTCDEAYKGAGPNIQEQLGLGENVYYKTCEGSYPSYMRNVTDWNRVAASTCSEQTCCEVIPENERTGSSGGGLGGGLHTYPAQTTKLFFCYDDPEWIKMINFIKSEVSEMGGEKFNFSTIENVDYNSLSSTSMKDAFQNSIRNVYESIKTDEYFQSHIDLFDVTKFEDFDISKVNNVKICDTSDNSGDPENERQCTWYHNEGLEHLTCGGVDRSITVPATPPADPSN